MKSADEVIASDIEIFFQSLALRFLQTLSDHSYMQPNISPLERIVGATLNYGWVYYLNAYCLEKVTAHFFNEPMAFHDWSPKGFIPAFCIWHQAKVGPYAADFLIRSQRGENSPVTWIAIECDGHDFHERTKNQAAHDKKRDRFFQKNGIVPLRFTGSEIWADPFNVNHEIMELLQHRAVA